MKKSTKDLITYAGVGMAAYTLFNAVAKGTAAPPVAGLGAWDDGIDTSSFDGPDPSFGVDPRTIMQMGPPGGGIDPASGGYATPPHIVQGDPYQGHRHSHGHPWWRWRRRGAPDYNSMQGSSYNPYAWWNGGGTPSPYDNQTTFGSPGSYYGSQYYGGNYDPLYIEQPGSLEDRAAHEYE